MLDSVVAPNGPDVLNRSTFEALPRVLRQICARGACRGVTRNPVSDLARLLQRMHRGPVRARLVGVLGHSSTVSIRPGELLQTLLAGDFSGRLRAEFVTAVRAAVEGDAAPLARLFLTVGRAGGEGEFDGPLYYATTCEEQSFPWNRTAGQAQKLREAEAAIRALPRSAFAPFTGADALELSDIPACSAWPYPAVPAGERFRHAALCTDADPQRRRRPADADLGARELARTIPGSHLLIVPFTGHSVLGDDPSTCSGAALQALFNGQPIKPCRNGPPPARLRPQSPPARTLSSVSPQPGYSGPLARSAHGVVLTVADLARQLSLQSELEGSSGEPSFFDALVTGLRAGVAEISPGKVQLRDYSLIPGLTLSGTIRPESATLVVGGSLAAHGTLHRGSTQDAGGHTRRPTRPPTGQFGDIGSYCRHRCGDAVQISVLAIVTGLLALSLTPGTASATLSFIPCAEVKGFACASLGVPLDRSGAVSGTISLSVERKLAGRSPSSSAMVALAGGPGQSALPFAAFTAKTMAAGLKSRDLLLFDQRGTGSSDPLSCPALRRLQPGRRGSHLSALRRTDRPGTQGLHHAGNGQRHRGPAGWRAATTSWSSTAPPTAPRWRWSTPNATPSTSKHCCSTRWCRAAAPNHWGYRPSRPSGR